MRAFPISLVMFLPALMGACDWSVQVSTSNDSATDGNDDASASGDAGVTTDPPNPTTSTTTVTTGEETTGEPPDSTTTGEDTTGGDTDGGNNGIPAEEVLGMPVCRHDGNDEYAFITEGWIYSKMEQAIHGDVNHRALDMALPYGEPVFAAASGWALATTELYPTFSEEGVKIGLGGGLLVVIWHPQLELFTQYLHLSGVEGLPYYQPTPYINGDGFDSWYPDAITKPASLFMGLNVAWVEKGSLIGYIGTSGLASQADEMPSANPPQMASWDEPHLHFQVHGDRDVEGKKNPKTIYDPANIYMAADEDFPYLFFFEVCGFMMQCDPIDDLYPLYPEQCQQIIPLASRRPVVDWLKGNSELPASLQRAHSVR